MSNWQTVTLEDVAESINTGLDAIRRAPIVEHQTNLRCLRIQDISQDKPFNEWGFTETKKSDYEKYKLTSGDIIIARTGGSIGVNKLIRNDLESVFNNGLARIRANKNFATPEFIYCVMQSINFKSHINAISSGTAAQPNMKVGDMAKFEFKLPPLNEQKKITETIFAFIDKIHLNTQINQTLEQIAQALFKSWFVDFDPVRAKAQALSDGLSLEQAELAAMQAISRKTPEELTALSQTQPERYAELAETAKAFPCEMVEVDEVEVPKGWRIGSFTDITESRREKVKNDKATVLSAVSSGELVKSEEYFTKQVFSKSIDKYLKVYKWDFAYNPARINIGSIGLHEADYLGAVSPVYEVFSVPDKYHWFLKRILNLETTKIKIQSLCTGSVRQTLKLKDFQSIDCVIPDEKTLSIFNKKWEEYRTLILENNKNTQTLSEIRDLLLPRLLSGKIEND